MELLKIEQYVDMVLGYLRLDSDVHRLLSSRTSDLDGLLRQAVRKFAPNVHPQEDHPGLPGDGAGRC